MKVALYARVSTTKRKDAKGAEVREYEQNPLVQLEPMRAYAESQKWTVVGPQDAEYGVCYFDRASGADTARPMLRRLLQDAAKRKFEAVLCWKFDRISRDALHLLEITRALDAASVDFVSLTEKLDTTTPWGKMAFGILAMVAQFERDVIQERVRAGMDQAKRRGVKFGRPRAKVPVLLLDEDVRGGMSIAAACRKRGVNRQTGRKALLAWRWREKEAKRGSTDCIQAD